MRVCQPAFLPSPHCFIAALRSLAGISSARKRGPASAASIRRVILFDDRHMIQGLL